MDITFGIVTDGKRPAKLWRQVQSIHDLNCNNYELLIAGELPDRPIRFDYRYLPTYACQLGQLGRMRNLICQESRNEIIVITDDDILFKDDFLIGLEKYGNNFDILCTRLLNPDGTRNWDWVTKGGRRGHILLEYWETDPRVYCTGGRIVLKKSVWNKVKWDDTKGMNQEEDVDFSHRALKAGYSIKFNKYSTLIHDDNRYTENNRQMIFRG